MARSRSWMSWILWPIGLLFLVVAGKWMWMIVTREPLHPNPQAIPSVTQTHPPPRWAAAANQARRAIQSGMSGQSLPSVSVAVGAAGSVIWSEAFGWADIESRTPASPETRFRIGTASTALTSAGVGVLLEKGSLKLDDEIQTYVPEYPRKPQGPLTLRQLMSHTGGVSTDDTNEGPVFRQRCEHPAEALPHFANASLLFQPGAQYQRSNYGWILVSAAVEAAAKRPFLAFMKESVFQPLRMEATGAESTTEENPERTGEPEEDPPFFKLANHLVFKPFGLATGPKPKLTQPPTYYALGFGNDPQVRYGLHVTLLRNVSCFAGSLAFLSTPTDLVRFGLAMNTNPSSPQLLLQPATVQALQAPHKSSPGHGLGWDSSVNGIGNSLQAVGSNGDWMGGKVASLMLLRGTGSGIVIAITTNATHADAASLATQVAEAFSLGPRE